MDPNISEDTKRTQMEIVWSITHKRGELVGKKQHILMAHIRSRGLPPNIRLLQQKYFFYKRTRTKGKVRASPLNWGKEVPPQGFVVSSVMHLLIPQSLTKSLHCELGVHSKFSKRSSVVSFLNIQCINWHISESANRNGKI